jgi:prolyl-tRNA editing enzyme YbaK/EbsC (Cys-tRNA(Pro) deacylase)
VFVADGDPVVCVASGRAATGFAIGGVPPFGHDLPVLFDEELLRHERVWAAAGDPHSLFCVDPRELARCIKARIVPLAE